MHVVCEEKIPIGVPIPNNHAANNMLERRTPSPDENVNTSSHGVIRPIKCFASWMTLMHVQSLPACR